MSRSAAAIVTTLRDAGASLESFVAYHLAIGFAHLFLFFDDPDDPGLARFSGHPKVTVIAHDERLRKSWTALAEYPGLAGFIDSEVMARQVLNAALAMELARGFDWLLHIDADELFFPLALPVPEHFFEALSQPFDALYYDNLEAVPEKPDIDDPFLEVDLFKLPPEAGQDNEIVRRLLADTPQIPARRFHFYANGKSAVRLAGPLRPDGVHRFGGENPRKGKSADAYILHYACCGFYCFWRKYALLGAFADSWLDSIDIRSSIGPLHLDARDVVARGDRDAALAFYRRRIAIEDPNLVQGLIQNRILVRVPEPRQLLQNIASRTT